MLVLVLMKEPGARAAAADAGLASTVMDLLQPLVAQVAAEVCAWLPTSPDPHDIEHTVLPSHASHPRHARECCVFSRVRHATYLLPTHASHFEA